jgi:dihydrofolate reductase
MPKLSVFNSITLDGYFTDARGDMSWAHGGAEDPEWNAFVNGNASGGDGTLLFGRVTYEMMASFWPTDEASKAMPAVAEGMNRMPKVVFSRTMEKAAWANTRVVRGDLVAEVKRMKDGSGGGLTILGSGSIVAQLAQARLVDEYQMVMVPVVLGHGRTMFEGLRDTQAMKLARSRAFSNGKVVLWYEPA